MKNLRIDTLLWRKASEHIECPNLCVRQSISSISSNTAAAKAAEAAMVMEVAPCMCQLWNANREPISAPWINYFSVDRNAHAWVVFMTEPEFFRQPNSPYRKYLKKKRHTHTHAQAHQKKSYRKTLQKQWMSMKCLFEVYAPILWNECFFFLSFIKQSLQRCMFRRQ